MSTHNISYGLTLWARPGSSSRRRNTSASVTVTVIMNICAKFYWNPSTTWGDWKRGSGKRGSSKIAGVENARSSLFPHDAFSQYSQKHIFEIFAFHTFQNPAFSTPAFSTPAVWCRVFHSRVFSAAPPPLHTESRRICVSGLTDGRSDNPMI